MLIICMAHLLPAQDCQMGWASGTEAVVIGAVILAVFMAMLSYLTLSGSIVAIFRVMEVTPTSPVVEIPVKPNVPMKAGAVQFRTDLAPFEYTGPSPLPLESTTMATLRTLLLQGTGNWRLMAPTTPSLVPPYP